MKQRKILPIILLFLLLPCKVQLFVVPFDLLAGWILNIIWGGSAPYPEIIDINPMITMDTGEIIEYYGYGYERHEVVTEDGYILELHRIINNRSTKNSLRKTPLLLVPGLMAESSSFILLNETHSPGFFFANAGYDVWLHNNRGTRYSKKHKTLNAHQNKYWNFSFHEMGVYDMPATVDYILETTDEPYVSLTGLSMGGAAISIFLSEKPSYLNKVKEAFLWAPAIHVSRVFLYMGQMGIVQLCNILLYALGETEVLPYSKNIMLLFSHLCSGPIMLVACQAASFFGTLSIPLVTADRRKEGALAFMLGHIGGTSVKVLRHFIQMVVRNDFSQYDYGPRGNLIAYNQTNAPPYILQNIRQPIHIYYSYLDLYVNKEDVEEMSASFGNLKTLQLIQHKPFSHMDYVLSVDAKRSVFEPMLLEMAKPFVPLVPINIITAIKQSINASIKSTHIPAAIPSNHIPAAIPSNHMSNPITSTQYITTPFPKNLTEDTTDTDYSFTVILMIILVVLVIMLFVKLVFQQLSESKVKRSESKESLEEI